MRNIHRISRSLIAATIIATTVSCTLSETVSVVVRPMPTLRIGYDRHGMRSLRAYVFDNKGLFVDSVICPNVTDTVTLDLLRGVPQGSYTVVSYANAEDMLFAPLTRGVSGIEHINCYIKPENHTSHAPDMHHSQSKFEVRRTDQIETRTVEFQKLYHDVKFIVQGVVWGERFDEGYGARLSSLTTAYDGTCVPIEAQGIHIAQFMRQGDEFIDEFRTLKCDETGFRFEFWNAKHTILDLVIKPGSGIDISGDEMTIVVRVLSGETSITIGDWEYVVVNDPSAGG